MKFETLCARGAEAPAVGRPVGPVIVPSSTFSFESQAAVDRHYTTGEGYVYSRYGNPTVLQAESFLENMEGAGAALLFASGMAAITTSILTVASAGDKIAAQRELYGGSAGFLADTLPEMGIEVIWFGTGELGALSPADLNGCKAFFAETPVNPSLAIVDLRQLSDVTRAAGATLIVDSTFATPALQLPLDLGADLVVHSASKYLGGHGDVIGGAVAGSAGLIARIADRRRTLGSTMDPFTAFLLMRGMRTLAVRMEAHSSRAEAVARAMRQHPSVERVHYPGLDDHPGHELAASQMSGFGGMLSLCIAGGRDAAVRVHDALQLFVRAGSLGGVESLVSIPAAMSHRSLSPEERQRAGVADNMIRLSVGLEAASDLIDDLERALETAG